MLMHACRATITYSNTIPAKFPFGQRSFVKASFFDSGKSLLVSKSVLYAPLPEVRSANTTGMLLACSILGRCRSTVLTPATSQPAWRLNGACGC